MTLLHDDAHIQEVVTLRKKALQSAGETFQLCVFATGEWNVVKSAWVVVDEMFYKFTSLIEAIDVAFKIIYALQAEFPLKVCLEDIVISFLRYWGQKEDNSRYFSTPDRFGC